MCDDSGSSSDSGGGGGGYSPPSEPSYSPPSTPSYSPPSEPVRDYSPPPDPTPRRDESPGPFSGTNPEHPHEDTSDFQPAQEPAYPSAAELFAADLLAGTIEELLYDEDESYDEYYVRTGRRYHGKKRDGKGRTRLTSVPGKNNLATTARSPKRTPAATSARSPATSPASRDTDTVLVTVASESNVGRNAAILASIVATLAILYSLL